LIKSIEVIEDLKEDIKTKRAMFPHKRSKGKVRTAVDVLTGSEKRNYIRPGEVKISNMYDRIISWKEFLELDRTSRARYLKHQLNLPGMSRKSLAKAMGATIANVQSAIKTLKLYGSIPGRGPLTEEQRMRRFGSRKSEQKEEVKERDINMPADKIELDGESHRFAKIARGDVIEARVNNIIASLDPCARYYIRMEIVEVLEPNKEGETSDNTGKV
jgi:hypothetical protein